MSDPPPGLIAAPDDTSGESREDGGIRSQRSTLIAHRSLTGQQDLHLGVVVVGGGPAGAATALALARAGVSVLVVGGGDGGGDKPGESLSPSVMPLLERLGVREAFLATGPLACHGNRSIWGDAEPAGYDFICDPYGPGWHIDRRGFEGMLVAAVRAAGAAWQSDSLVTGVTREGSRWRVEVESSLPAPFPRREGGDQDHGRTASCAPSAARQEGPRSRRVASCSGEASLCYPLPSREGGRGVRWSVTADVMVDATGRRSAVARRLGARRQQLDRLVGAIAFLEPAGPPTVDTTTLVEATADGWWYSALVPDGRLSTAFMTDADLPSARRAATRDGWESLLANARHTRARVSAHGYVFAGRPRLTPAGSSRLDPVAGEGWLAAGDAAAAFDPLSSHGIATALAGGMHAAAAIRSWLAGDDDALHQYARRIERWYAQYLTMREAYYREERRWPDAEFWKRRQRHRASGSR